MRHEIEIFVDTISSRSTKPSNRWFTPTQHILLAAMAGLGGQAAGITFDEYGRPFVVIRDQEKKARLSGIDAQKVRDRFV